MKTLKPLILALSIFFASLFGLHTLANETGDKNMIRMTTSLGDIEIELYPDDAPDTVKNFLSYVESGHFDGLVFHRVIPGFMIQGGGFTPDMNQRPTQPPIKNEADNGLKNLTGTLSMARTSVPDSATSQFFINLVDNGFLDYTAKTQQGWGYAVFAKVVEGMDVVKQIGGVATGNVGGHGDVPLEPVYIEKAEVISN
jgi:cyclophilin family peptidyl-prolyl cis-trans isomerase